MSYRALIYRTKRSIKSIKAKLDTLAGDWADLDECIRAELECASTSLDAIVVEINEVYPPRRSPSRGAR